MDLADLTASCEVVTVGNSEYRISPLSVKDLGELDRWMVTYPIDQAKRMVNRAGNNVDRKTAIQTVKDGLARSKDNLYDDKSPLDMYLTLDGAVKVVSLSLLHNHTTEDIDKFFDSIGQESLVGLVYQILNLSGIIELGDFDNESQEEFEEKLGKELGEQPNQQESPGVSISQ